MGISEEKVGTLEDTAKQRRERLAALKRKREENKSDETSTTDSQPALPKPVFRSYRPADEKLKEAELPDAEPGNVEALITDSGSADNQQEKTEQVDIAQLAPRKPDWDLKRDLAPRLERLERRTQRAIAELIRERLQAHQTPENLADAVSRASAATVGDQDD